MRILLVGAGGVGGAAALIAARRTFFERLVVADFDPVRAEKAVAAAGDPRFVAARVDATDEAAVAALLAEHRCDALLNATDPRFVMPLFRAALAAGAHYLDMAMSLSRPHPERPYEETGVKLGDEQFALAGEWEAAGRLALVGIGVEPGPGRRLRPVRRRPPVLRDRRARRARRLEPDRRAATTSRPSFSHLDDDRGVPQPAGDLGAGPRLVHHRAVQRAGGLRLPRGHRPGRVRERGARGGAAHAALGRRPAGDVQVRPGRGVHRRPARRCTSSAWTAPTPVRVGDVEVSPRDVVAACLPDPADARRPDERQDLRRHVGQRHGHGRPAPARCTCTTWSTTSGRCASTAPRPSSGRPRSTRSSPWSCSRRAPGRAPASSAPRRSTPVPFLDLLTAYGSPWGMREGG